MWRGSNSVIWRLRVPGDDPQMDGLGSAVIARYPAVLAGPAWLIASAVSGGDQPGQLRPVRTP